MRIVRLGFLVTVPMMMLACAPDSSIPESDEETEEIRDDIVGGQATSDFAAVGALTRFGGTHCTGTLIGPRKVVTAAHCVKGVSASSLKFVLGPSLSSAQHVLNVASVQAHPNYNANQLTNDIGIVTLSQDAPVAPMGVLPAMDASWVGRELIFVGYGNSNGVSQTGAGTKRMVRMNITQVSSTTFRYQQPGKNTCNGDSGGPAFADVNGQRLVAGVTSWGDANCTQFGVDTRTDTYKTFLGVGTTPPADPCQGETFAGKCSNNTVIWCENNQVHQSNCTTQGKTCGFSAANQYFACLDAPPPPPADPCNGETFEGRCEGNKLIWCENQQVKTLTCQTCGFDSQNDYFNCL